MKKLLVTFGLVGLGFQAVHAYDVTDRYKLLEDRFKTQDMLEPVGHDFFFEVKLGANMNLVDVINDASDVADTPGSDQDRLEAAQGFLQEYENTEQTINAQIGLGFPLPSFSISEVKFRPNFRASWNLGVNMGIRQEKLDVSNILQLIDVDLPSNIETQILDMARAGAFNQGDDIVQEACTAASIPQNQCDPYINEYFYPDDDVPNILMLAKQDVKAGIYTSYNYGKNVFGSLNIYGMHRTDLFARVSQEDISREGDLIDLGDELNSETYLTADWHIGWKHERYSVFGGIEEVKIATITEREEGSKAPTYGTDPLMRLHGQAEYKLSNLTLTPFAGLHKRSGYGLDEGLYVGADVMAHVWRERLALRFRGQLDKEHITLSPMMRLWFFHLDYTLKQPLSSSVDDVEVSALHSLNMRFFF